MRGIFALNRTKSNVEAYNPLERTYCNVHCSTRRANISELTQNTQEPYYDAPFHIPDLTSLSSPMSTYNYLQRSGQGTLNVTTQFTLFLWAVVKVPALGEMISGSALR